MCEVIRVARIMIFLNVCDSGINDRLSLNLEKFSSVLAASACGAQY